MATNQDIFTKLATLEANINNMGKDISDIQDDIKQIKRDTANVGLVKSIVFGIVIIVMLAFMGGIVNLLLPHTTTQASTLPSTGVQANP